MSDETEDVNINEEPAELDDSDIDITLITYEDKDLFEWEEELSVQIPSLPCNAQSITKCLIDIANKYQIAYNAYNRLMVVASKAENAFKAEKFRLCNAYIDAARSKGVKTIPAMDKIEMAVLNNDKNIRLRSMMDRYKVLDELKDFFANNKTKLERVMSLAKELTYTINASDKIYQASQYRSGGIEA